ncbi:MAG: DUF4260 domain-containing protein [Aggregatilineales bacterium]
MAQTATAQREMRSLPRLLLRIEGGILFVGAIALYASFGGAPLPFIVLLLVPDLSAIGYLVGPAMGARLYNAGHTMIGPAALLAFGLFSRQSAAIQLACIWGAHIGLDRLLGYGLKYPSRFKETHLSRV